MSELKFGPLDDRTCHVCVDMQRIFLEPGPWYGEACVAIVEPVRRLCEHGPWPTLFTRFITAVTPAAAEGAWRRYYDHWHEVTQIEAGTEVLDLHSRLAEVAAPDSICDKVTHDSFDDPSFAARIEAMRPSAIILSGIETDVCVLATAMSAVDLGYRTVIATDAVASSVPVSHQACLDHVYPRFDQQIELANVDTILLGGRAS
ncbi:MAG: cysteine hydrolase [Rhodospirillales bacterium]